MARPVASKSRAKVQSRQLAARTEQASGAGDDVSAKQQAPASVQSIEPEDAYLTGGSRNLQRRVLGLNVRGKQAEQSPEAVAGQHATGSFTDKKPDKKSRK